MKRFKFRLEKVLQYRQLIKDEKRRELLARNQELQEARERLNELEAAAAANRLAEGIVSAGEVHIAGLYAERLDREIAAQKVTIAEAEQAAEAALADYIEAAKEAEALVILKRRRMEEYLNYMQKEEEKFLDEVTVQKGNTLNHKEDEL